MNFLESEKNILHSDQYDPHLRRCFTSEIGHEEQELCVTHATSLDKVSN